MSFVDPRLGTAFALTADVVLPQARIGSKQLTYLVQVAAGSRQLRPVRTKWSAEIWRCRLSHQVFTRTELREGRIWSRLPLISTPRWSPTAALVLSGALQHLCRALRRANRRGPSLERSGEDQRVFLDRFETASTIEHASRYVGRCRHAPPVSEPAIRLGEPEVQLTVMQVGSVGGSLRRGNPGLDSFRCQTYVRMRWYRGI